MNRYEKLLTLLSFDVRHNLSVIKFLAIVTIAFGLSMTALDIVVGMPLLWTAAEGPTLVVLYSFMLRLANRVSGSRSDD